MGNITIVSVLIPRNIFTLFLDLLPSFSAGLFRFLIMFHI